MLDFKELSQDGTDLELLVREILLVKGYRVFWSGKGADGGRDLICIEERGSDFMPDRKIWLIQCKHNAIGGSSVGIKDLDDILGSCTQHNAKGYLLVCSTFPSSAVVNRLEGITKNEKSEIDATYWDATRIEQILSTPSLWKIAQRFFPTSSKNSSWEIFATENPNKWIANYRGYHFHLINRIGSKNDYHFESINNRINDIKKILLPDGHFIRIRAVYFDDKNGAYTWYIDYMHPKDKYPVKSTWEIEQILGDGYALEDGQIYSFDVRIQPYFEYSDHYDKDHYDYYEGFIKYYNNGLSRPYGEISSKNGELIIEYKKVTEEFISGDFNLLLDNLNKIPNIKLIRAVNSSVENIDKFNKINNWSNVVEAYGIESDNFFNIWLILEAKDEKEIISLFEHFPQTIECSFRMYKTFIFLPKDTGDGCTYDNEEDNLYEIKISASPIFENTAHLLRLRLNEFVKECNKGIEKYINSSKFT